MLLLALISFVWRFWSSSRKMGLAGLPEGGDPNRLLVAHCDASFDVLSPSVDRPSRIAGSLERPSEPHIPVSNQLGTADPQCRRWHPGPQRAFPSAEATRRCPPCHGGKRRTCLLTAGPKSGRPDRLLQSTLRAWQQSGALTWHTLPADGSRLAEPLPARQQLLRQLVVRERHVRLQRRRCAPSSWGKGGLSFDALCMLRCASRPCLPIGAVTRVCS